MHTKEVTSKRTGKPVIVLVMTEEEYHEECEQDGGVCLVCGELAYGVEPDARKYQCESCEEPRVYGLEEAMIMGRIEIAGLEGKWYLK